MRTTAVSRRDSQKLCEAVRTEGQPCLCHDKRQCNHATTNYGVYYCENGAAK